MTRAIRIIVFAALATALTAALHSGAASAQTPETNPDEREAKAAEQAADDSPGVTTDDSIGAETDGSPGPATADSTSKVTSDATGLTPTTAKPVSVKPSKRISKPFKPTEKIDAESVISFPANI
jgi:hypothetical protein